MRRLATLLILLTAGLAIAGDATGPFRTFTFRHSGAIDVNHGGNATMWIDFSQDPSGATITTSDGGYTLTKAGAPARVNDGTWPTGLSGSQGYAHSFDGAADYWTRADDGSFDFGDDLTIHAAVTPSTVAAGEDCIVGKYETTANQKSWKLCRDAATVVFTLSADGSTDTTVTKAACLAAGRPAFITATYDKSATTANLYVDNLAVETSGAMAADLFDSSAALEIGASDTGAALWAGKLHHLVVSGVVLKTEADHDFAYAQWQGRMSTSGGVATVTSSNPPSVVMAPPASGTEPFIIPQPANSSSIGSPASGSGGTYGAAAVTNLVQRASFETWASGTDATGWAETVTAGDGSAAMAQETGTVVHGANSAKWTLTGTTSSVVIDSACITTGIGSDLYVSGYAKKDSGTAEAAIQIVEWDAADCTSALATTAVWTGDLATDWARKEDLWAAASWDASTSSYQVRVREDCNGGCVVYWDAIQARAASTPTDAMCLADTDASAVCNDVVTTIDNPLADIVGGTWEVSGTVRTPIDWASLGAANRLVLVLGTAGNNNRIEIGGQTDLFYSRVYDNAGSANLSSVAAAGNADTDYACTATKYFTGENTATWNGTSDATPASAAYHDGQSATMYLCVGSASTGSYLWLRDLQVSRRGTK